MKVQQGNNKLLLHKDHGYASVRIGDEDVSFSIRLCMHVCVCKHLWIANECFFVRGTTQIKVQLGSELLLDETDTDTHRHTHTHTHRHTHTDTQTHTEKMPPALSTSPVLPPLTVHD